jgi:hypothetical protein
MRAVVLNSNIWSVANQAMTLDAADPGDKFHWLNNVLRLARRAGEKVGIC